MQRAFFLLGAFVSLGRFSFFSASFLCFPFARCLKRCLCFLSVLWFVHNFFVGCASGFVASKSGVWMRLVVFGRG